MIVEPAPAKINLALHVRHRRPDGYHELETLFAFARDGDVVTIEEAERDSFTIEGPFSSYLQSSPGRGGGPPAPWPVVEGKPIQEPPSNNLVLRARNAFRTFHPTPPLAITLTKNLPIASGIGGGSADAAATLCALARLTGVDPATLTDLAAQLGADVPACLLGRTALGTGRGDTLADLAGLAGVPLLLVNPGVAVSTAAVFAGWDGIDRGPLPPGDLLTRARAARNDLEPPAIALAPVIAEVCAFLAAAPAASLTRMSGSGATYFALFDTDIARDRAAAEATSRGWWCLSTKLS